MHNFTEAFSYNNLIPLILVSLIWVLLSYRGLPLPVFNVVLEPQIEPKEIITG